MAHVAKDLCLCPQPVLQVLKPADVLDSLLHRHHLKDARFLDHLLFLTEHHRQVTRVKLSVIAHSEGEDVVDLRLTQAAQMHRKSVKQLLYGSRHIVALKKMKNVLPYLLWA